MSDSVILYVKSRKISSYEGEPGVTGHHGYAGGPASSSPTFAFYKPEDQDAIEILKVKGMAHEIRDISLAPFFSRIRMGLTIVRTPTLVMEERKAVGLDRIRQMLNEK